MKTTFLYFIDWLDILLSFFNTITLLWLGVTVLLNADRRWWGAWVGAIGLIVGGIFFAGHTAVVGRVIGSYNAEIEFWWWAAWLPFISSPYMWYVVMVGYTGALESRLHRMWFVLTSVLGLSALVLLVVANPIPSLREVLLHQGIGVPTIGGIVPVVSMVYPVYSTLCVILSLLALFRPTTSNRFMGDLARKRARPWLIVASFVLLVVSLSIGGALGWFLYAVQTNSLPQLTLSAISMAIAFDLFISGLIAVIVFLVGKAVVSYEIFTDKVMPRGGLRRHWHSSLAFAMGYSALVASILAFDLSLIFVLLLVTIAVTLRYATFSWRDFTEREHSMARLRPFVTSQRIYEQLTTDSTTTLPEIDTAVPLRALCEDILKTKIAYLVAIGPLAALVGAVQPYTRNGKEAPPIPDLPLAELLPRFDTPQTMCVAVDPSRHGGATWAISLWSERGLIGVLLVGEKQEQGLYTLEEMEIARAVGERLIDTQASVEMARRLMSLQRQRLAESQVLDRRTRRVLHDDILPELHTAMLFLSSIPDNPMATQAMERLSSTHRQIADLLHTMPATSASDVGQLGLIGALRQVVDHELGKAFDRITWDIAPDAEDAARTIPPLTAEVIFYAAREAIRNAACYGRGNNPNRPLSLTMGVRSGDQFVLSIGDDGVGMGTSNAPREGKGHGLALHSTMMAVIGGTLTVESVPAEYTRVSLAIPL